MDAREHVIVVARWQAAPGASDEVLAAATEMRRESLAEPGCLGYELFRPVDAPDALLLIERYRDDAAVEAHRASSHFRELVLGRIVPLLVKREVELLRPRAAD